MAKHKVPTPGSNTALSRGCLCAVLDNAHGLGYLGVTGIFCITEGCPLHDLAAKKTPAAK